MFDELEGKAFTIGISSTRVKSTIAAFWNVILIQHAVWRL
jgi:hypothetical protein